MHATPDDAALQSIVSGIAAAVDPATARASIRCLRGNYSVVGRGERKGVSHCWRLQIRALLWSCSTVDRTGKCADHAAGSDATL